MLNRLKISLILAPLALILLIGVYIYSLWAADRSAKADIPFDASGSMSRDLLKFHEKRGTFPSKLEDLEEIIWEAKQRNFSLEGRALTHRNYLYLYTRISAHRYTLWVIPMGKSRDEAPTLYLAADLFANRIWKGPAIPMNDVKDISPFATATELSLLGMVEQSRSLTPPVK